MESYHWKNIVISDPLSPLPPPNQKIFTYDN
jgi:hypothetical protein